MSSILATASTISASSSTAVDATTVPSAAAAATAITTTVAVVAAHADVDEEGDANDDYGDTNFESFFTNKEYVLQSHQYERITLECWSLQPNTTDADLTG